MAAAAGRDVLLVMPTGAGKSLCYQLPALARRATQDAGSCLVISPLIALMDDQATKLSALGLRVARIHSGLDRDEARQACRDYLDGRLDFLFIAPERMRVPGFPEMLAKRKPALIAIDEAHCISAWGHDFRPDYRTLGQYLPALRPAPIVALTATATPTVQRDIARQLDLQDPAIFITGFHRDNLAVEVVELSKPERPEYTARLLADASARPAIVYAASRKDAESFAAHLNRKFSAQAYHAGLGPQVREKVQNDFLSGKLDVVVATVAFGMGIDKANVRTVVHVALPGSVEAYYQEIGRAGRDGQPSRTILLHGYADRRMQDFLLDKNFPSTADLDRVARALPDEFRTVDSLQEKLHMERETLERSIEKLIAVGVATMDIYGDVRAISSDAAKPGAQPAWKASYESLVSARRAQVDRMAAFAEGHQCRMSALVAHFGDTSTTPCGRCDICSPGGSTARSMGAETGHAPTASEKQELRTILRALEQRGQSTGKLFNDLGLRKDRKEFDRLLDALARAALITMAPETFTNAEGTEITYRKATITHEGREPDDATLDTVWLSGAGAAKASSRSSSKSSSKSSAKSSRAVSRAGANAVRGGAAEEAPLSAAATQLFEQLRLWRAAVARPTNTPAFLILPDATLRSIAAEAPQSLADLASVRGLGQAKLDRFGADILAVCRGDVARSSPKATQLAAEPRVAHSNPPKKTTPSRPSVMPAPRPSSEARIVSLDGPRAAAPIIQRPAAPRPAPARVALPSPAALTAEQLALEESLKQWRRETAHAAGLPTFFVVPDSVLRQIAIARPTTLSALEKIAGLNTEKRDQHGAAIVALCRG